MIGSLSAKMRLSAALLALLGLANGCGAQPASGGAECATSTRVSTARLLGLSGLPDWTLGPGLPLGTREDLTGLWTPLPSRWIPLPARRVDHSGVDPIAPGPVERRVGCQWHYGIEAVMLRQEGDRVLTRWIWEAGASGAESRESHSSFEIDEGDVAGGLVRLSGVGVSRTYYEDGERPEVLYRPVTYELRFEEATGHLVGTRNGEPFRLVPLSLIQASADECPEAPP